MSTYAVFELADGTRVCSLLLGVTPEVGAFYVLRIDGLKELGRFFETLPCRAPCTENADLVGKADDNCLMTREASSSLARRAEAFVLKKMRDARLNEGVVRTRATLFCERIYVTLSLFGYLDVRSLCGEMKNQFKQEIQVRFLPPREMSGRIGGLGICGLKLCCMRGLCTSVDTEQARASGADLRNISVAGCCGKIRCCFRFEEGSETGQKNQP
ncbi:MAG: hypothetical protein ACI4QT_02955 [Kiritimatiellia bacterium]